MADPLVKLKKRYNTNINLTVFKGHSNVLRVDLKLYIQGIHQYWIYYSKHTGHLKLPFIRIFHIENVVLYVYHDFIMDKFE